MNVIADQLAQVEGLKMRFAITIGMILVLSALGLTYEIAAGRVLAPFFGTSLLTWTTVIAVILAGFSLGSALGGLVAEGDSRLAARRVRAALIATAILMAVSPVVLSVLYSWGARGTDGMFMAVFIAFFPASVLVSFPSPFLAKMAVEARPGREGSSLGLVLAAGSMGAIVGAILAGFVTLPLLGSVATFAGCGAVALGCVPMVRGKPADADAGEDAHPTSMGTILSVAIAALAVVAGFASGSVCRYESGLSCIDVSRQGSVITLHSDRTEQAAERVVPNEAQRDGARDLVMPYAQWIWTRMDIDLGSSPSVLFIGGGGYTLPTRLLESRPEARAIAVEIDPLITSVVRQHLPTAGAMVEKAGYAMGADGRAHGAVDGRLGIVHADGRVFLNETQQRFDAVVMDAFSSGSVPAHLATLEAYERLRAVVDGPVYVNLIDAPDGRLVRGVHAILRDLYPYTEAVQGPVSTRGRANIVLTASPRPIVPPDVLPKAYEPVGITAARAFTDDRGWVGHR